MGWEASGPNPGEMGTQPPRGGFLLTLFPHSCMTPCEERLKTSAVWHHGRAVHAYSNPSLPALNLAATLLIQNAYRLRGPRLSAPPVPGSRARLSPPGPYLINKHPSFTQVSLSKAHLSSILPPLTKYNPLNPFLHHHSVFGFSPCVLSVIRTANT